jgi:hypothetical protein
MTEVKQPYASALITAGFDYAGNSRLSPACALCLGLSLLHDRCGTMEVYAADEVIE